MVSSLKAVLLNSGGIDSRVVAAIARRRGWELHSIYLDCNPLNRDRALPAAERTAALYCDHHEVLVFPDLMITSFPDLPGGIPFSSVVMISMAMAYAKKHDRNLVLAGTRNDIWEDDFVSRFMNLLTCHKKHIEPPLLSLPVFHMTAQEVAERAKELEVPLEDTTSCGRAIPNCGCKKCNDRAALGLPIL